MARQRTSITQSDLDKIARFLNALGAKPSRIEMFPGRVVITIAEGSDLTLPDNDAETKRKMDLENWT